MGNNSIIGEIYKYYKKNYNKLFFYSKIVLIIIFSLSFIYLIEKFIIYNIIFYFLFIFSDLFHLEKYNIFSLKFESFFLLIYFHVLFIRIIILSIIFIQGGIFKRILVYDQYFSFISKLQEYLNKTIENLSSNNYNEIEFFINKLEILRKSIKSIKSKKMDLKSIDSNLENYFNDIFDKYNNYKINNSKENVEYLIESLKKISNCLGLFPKLSLLQKFFTFNYYESLILMEEYMINSFQTHYAEKRSINKNFDIYILTPKNPSNKSKDILTIYCNQNAICCELYSIAKENIVYYLDELKCSIILWNYKGFGLRKGFTTFGNIDKDVDILSNFIKNNYNKYKIIIHGCSIGGYSSIKLTQKISLYNDALLISDRTFGDIKSIVKSLNYNKILIPIYNIILPQYYYKYRNIENYIVLPYDKKLILFDEYDEIIKYNPASLVFNITEKFFTYIIRPKISKYEKYYFPIKNIKKISEKLKQLAVDCNDQQFDKNGRIFIQHMNHYVNKINSIEQFFMFFIIFGYPFNRFKEIDFNLDKLKKVYIKIPFIFKNIIQNNVIIDKEIIDIIKSFNFIFIKLNLCCNITDDNILNLNYDDKINFLVESNHMVELLKYFGYVHRIYCGHNGRLEDKDIYAIKEFLKKNKFI